MLAWLKSNSTTHRAATDLYGCVVAQAREPVFYRDFGVPDTAEGRYEMIVLHMFAVIERLRNSAQTRDAERLARELTSVFVTDMDDNFREMGVGDLTVPRKVKKAAGALYDRTMAYRALAGDGDANGLAAALAENCGLGGATVNGAALAHYLKQLEQSLAEQPDASLLAGQVQFDSVQ
ncbi:MAG: ubiquinol-cytochrome C chaperone family protein [Pseudomonadota bacterium]